MPSRYWNVQTQIADLERLDQYLESVSDQQRPLRESEFFGGRLMLRSQRNPERFWVLDAWTERYALDAGQIMLRTLSSVAAVMEAPRELPTEQIPVGSNGLGEAEAPPRAEGDPLPFFLIIENHVKPVTVDEYIETQDAFTRAIEAYNGFRRRLLLRDVRSPAHFMVIDEWESEKHAFEAFEQRSATMDEITTTRFQSLLQERGFQDFALGLHA